MEIVIHGTKGGYHTFTKEKISLSDARPDSNKITAIGSVAYSISFKNNDIVYSKYRIIRDVQGDKRTGNIAFSIILKNSTKINGSIVKEILDDIHNQYIKNYIPKEDNNLVKVIENWDFLEEIKNKYRVEFPSNTASIDIDIPSATNDPAYIYYSEIPIDNFFENPIQREYFKYKQIFFIESKFKGEDNNPLNALRHEINADLTKIVDPSSKNYYIKEFDKTSKDGIKIDIWINGFPYSKGNTVNSNDTIRINYSKNKYFEEIDETGILFDKKIEPYLRIEKNIIELNNNIYLDEKEFKYNIHVYDINGTKTDKAEISITNSINKEEKKINNNISINSNNELNIFTVTFKGKEIQNKWIFFASLGNDLSSIHDSIIPEHKNDIEIKLKKQIILTVEVKNENGVIINDFILYPIGKNGSRIKGNPHIYFTEDEIKKNIKWSITVDHDSYCSEQFYFEPTTNTTKKIYLKFKSKSNNQKPTPGNGNGKDGSDKGTPKGTDTKTYNNLKYVLIFFISIALIGIGYFGYDFIFNTKKLESMPNTYKVEDYVNGNEMNIDTLNKFKSIYCDSSESLCQKIDEAIKIRNNINLGNIDLLLECNYSDQQNNFQNAISSINDIYKNQIGDTLNFLEVSKLNLDSIAHLINRVQNQLKKDEKVNDNSTALNNSSASNNTLDDKQKNNQLTKPIIEKVTSNNISNKKDLSKNNHKESTLESEFWTLVKSGNDQMNDYKNLLTIYKDNKETEIKIYLTKICKNSKSFSSFKNIAKIDRQEATELSDLN